MMPTHSAPGHVDPYTGVQPIVFVTGTAGQSGGWNDAGGINWGSGAKFAKVGSAARAVVPA